MRGQCWWVQCGVVSVICWRGIVNANLAMKQPTSLGCSPQQRQTTSYWVYYLHFIHSLSIY